MDINNEISRAMLHNRSMSRFHWSYNEKYELRPSLDEYVVLNCYLNCYSIFIALMKNNLKPGAVTRRVHPLTDKPKREGRICRKVFN